MAEFVEVMEKMREMCETYHLCDECPIDSEEWCPRKTYMSNCNFVNIEKIITNWEAPVGVDWSKVDVDTPILVLNDEGDMHKRYFAKYEDGHVYAWNKGRTSWTAKDEYDVSICKHAELVPRK